MQDDEIDLAIPARCVQCVFTVFMCNPRFVAQEMCNPRAINLYHTLLSMIYDSIHAIMAFKLGVYATSRIISTRIPQPACKIYSGMTRPGCFGCWSTRPRVSQPRTKTLLYGTRSNTERCVWAWLVLKFKVQLHARTPRVLHAAQHLQTRSDTARCLQPSPLLNCACWLSTKVGRAVWWGRLVPRPCRPSTSLYLCSPSFSCMLLSLAYFATTEGVQW